ncbi:hypothetical protein HWV62_36663, partial [Athelia sp. TMB]
KVTNVFKHIKNKFYEIVNLIPSLPPSPEDPKGEGTKHKKKKTKMNLSLLLFLIGILGFIINRKNIILMIISIEIMLLAVTLLILISSFSFDDNVGQTFSVYIISIAGAESVVGLSILVAYYRLRGNILITTT